MDSAVGEVLFDVLDVNILFDQLRADRVSARCGRLVPQHDHVVGHDFFHRPAGAVLGDILAIPQAAFDVDFTALFDVLLDDFTQLAPGNHVMEVDGFLLRFCLRVLPGVIRRQAEPRDRLT